MLLDLKGWNAERHRRLTGMDNVPVLEFARRLAGLRKPIWVRFVLVPGWSDNADDIARIADFAASLRNVERVDVLPFHQMGRYKWKELGIDYELAEGQPPSPEYTEEVCGRFRAAGLKTY